MTPTQIKQTISALAAHLKDHPELMESELTGMKKVLPHLSDEAMRDLVEKMAAPDFDVTTASAELQSILTPQAS